MLKLKVDTQAIIWDFDGVILNSNEVRDLGFIKVLEGYAQEDVHKLLDFHQRNGGLSRYVKFEYFYKEVLNQSFTEEDVQNLAKRFSIIMKELLIDKTLLIHETLEFIKEYYHTIPMHIISGSDGEELRYLCHQLEIDSFFKSIEGSPTPKVQNLSNLISRENYQPSELVLIGDSFNDFEAARDNGVSFLAYNNEILTSLSNY